MTHVLPRILRPRTPIRTLLPPWAPRALLLSLWLAVYGLLLFLAYALTNVLVLPTGP